MNFEYSEKSKELQRKLSSFIEEHIVPIEDEFIAFQSDKNNMWKRFPKIEMLKQKAKDAGLWNLFLPKDYGDLSPGLTNLEYAPLAEIMGKKIWISEIFNCSAPDTGNMEVLAKYGNEKQKKQWLAPLMNGNIRSAFFNDRTTSSLFRCHKYRNINSFRR
jgi:acyl-CoA dehydrogenase